MVIPKHFLSQEGGRPRSEQVICSTALRVHRAVAEGLRDQDVRFLVFTFDLCETPLVGGWEGHGGYSTSSL